jgi:hypothetical protein
MNDVDFMEVSADVGNSEEERKIGGDSFSSLLIFVEKICKIRL